MRRTVLFALMTALVLLWGCSSASANEEKYSEFQAALRDAESIEMTVCLTASYDSKVLAYKLFFTNSGGKSTVEIIAPELIAGIRAHVEDGKSALEYDGLILDTAALTETGLTPLSCLPALVECAKNGYVSRVWNEEYGDKKAFAVQSPVDDEVTMTLWLSEDGSTPLHCELIHAEKVIISCEIDEWILK